MSIDPNIWSDWAEVGRNSNAPVFVRQRNYGRDAVFVTKDKDGWWKWSLELRKPWVTLDGSWAFQYENGSGFGLGSTARDAADDFLRSVGLLPPEISEIPPETSGAPSVWDRFLDEAREGLALLGNNPVAAARFDQLEAFCAQQNKENPIAITNMDRKARIETALSHLIRGLGHEMVIFPKSQYAIDILNCIFNLEDELAALSK